MERSCIYGLVDNFRLDSFQNGNRDGLLLKKILKVR